MIGLVKLKGPEKVPFSTSGTSKMTRRENVVRKIGDIKLFLRKKKINISIGDDMELTLKQFKGAIKEDKQIYKKGG